MTTKIAISSQDQKTVTGHAGRCQNFFIYTVDQEGKFEKEAVHYEKDNTLHEGIHGTKGEHPLFDMDIILTLDLGQGAISVLETKGVRVYMIQEENPDTAITKLIDGSLKAYVAPEAHSHGHGGGGCGCGGH
jgi:predicted Fe-Mo cluster-binding NifX family protein